MLGNLPCESFEHLGLSLHFGELLWPTVAAEGKADCWRGWSLAERGHEG
jgi:hypothetical protein